MTDFQALRIRSIASLLQSHNDCNKRYQKEQKDADLIDGKAGVMNGVKGLSGETEPPQMHSVDPVMSKDKGGKKEVKKQPNPVGKGAPSDYQSGKTRSSSVDNTPAKKK